MSGLFDNWEATKSELLSSLEKSKPVVDTVLEEQRKYLARIAALPWHKRWLYKFQDWLYRHGLRKTTPYDKFRSIMIPMIRRILPGMIARDIVGVQPMQEPTGQALAFLINPPYARRQPEEGDRKHCIVRGWLRYDGTDATWILEEEWLRTRSSKRS